MTQAVAIIPARAGSKRVPGKNLQRIDGRSLVQRAMDQAAAATLVDRIVLSSDDPTALRQAEDAGVETIQRPAHLSTDEASSMAVLRHVIEELGLRDEDELVLLQPTSPFRTAQDIDRAIALRRETTAPFCVSVKQVEEHPAWMYAVNEEGKIRPFLDSPLSQARSQDLPTLYIPNGAVYVGLVAALRIYDTFFTDETVVMVMPPERSLDIDTPWQLELARAWACYRNREN